LEIDSGEAHRGISDGTKALSFKHFPLQRSSSVRFGKPRCSTGVSIGI